MSDWMNAGYGESLTTMQKMNSLGGDEAIIAKAMMLLGANQVPSYFLPERGYFLPNLGAFRAFMLLTESKEALLRLILNRTRCSVEVGRQELAELVGEEAMRHLDEAELHQGEIDKILDERRLRSEEVSALYSTWRRSGASEDKGRYDIAASLHNEASLSDTTRNLFLFREEAWRKMVEVMK